MMYAPGKVAPEEQQTTGIMMVCIEFMHGVELTVL